MLHNMEVVPFNPMSKESERKHKLHEATMQKLRKLLDSLPLEEEEKDNIEDVIFVRSCATLQLHGYALTDKGLITHKTPRGEELICKLRCADKPVSKNYRKALEMFVRS